MAKTRINRFRILGARRPTLPALPPSSPPSASIRPSSPSFTASAACFEMKTSQLHKVALFLPSGAKRMKSSHVHRSSAAGDIEHTYGAQKATLAVLFGWLTPLTGPHTAMKKQKLLEHCTSVLGGSQPLRCTSIPELVEVIKNVADPVSMTLWLAILWMKCKQLISEVRGRLGATTKEVAQGRERTRIRIHQCWIRN